MQTAQFDNLRDEDQRVVRRSFGVLLQFVSTFAPNIQVIVTDYADLNDADSSNVVLERWRGELN